MEADLLKALQIRSLEDYEGGIPASINNFTWGIRRNCPMGAPALLNGDFYRNVRDLKDFSWSVMFHTDPEEDGRIGQLFEKTEKQQKESGWLSDLTVFSLSLLYGFIFYVIMHKLISCIPVTRKFLLSFTLFMFLSNIYYCIYLMIWRSFGYGIWIYVHIHFVFICLLLQGHFICTEKFRCLQPPYAEFVKLRQKKIWPIFVITGILIFFFYPVHRSRICPHVTDRVFNELFCYCCIIHQIFIYFSLMQMLWHWTAKEFIIRKGKCEVGKLAKNRDGKWVQMKKYANGYFETKDLLAKPPLNV
ncbi:unnamed protein product [Caenorhabditis brenneri]